MINFSSNSPMRICKACGVWKLASDDVYCSYCGERVASLSASLSDNAVYFGDSGAHGEVTLSIINDGQTDINVDAISYEYNWVQAKYENSIIQAVSEKGINPPHHIPIDSQWDIPLAINLDEQSSYYNCNIQVKSVAGIINLAIQVLPKPRLIMHLSYPLSDDESKISDAVIEVGKAYADQEIPSCQIIRHSASKRESWSCYLEIHESIVTVESIEVGLKLEDEFELSQNIIILQHPSMPINLESAGIRRINFTLGVNVANFSISDHVCIIRIKCAKINEPIICEFIINRSSRPEIEFIRAEKDIISIQGEMRIRRENDTKEIDIEITNIGGLKVTISEVKIDTDWLEPLFELPKDLHSGQVESLNFQAKIGTALSKLMESNEPTAPAPIQMIGSLIFSFKCPDYPEYIIPTKKIEIFVTVALMPEYEGVVAIDFGTVNSCCAVESGAFAQKSNMVPLGNDFSGQNDQSSAQDRERREILPSVIYYRDEFEGMIDCLVGNQALAFSMMPDTSSCTVRSIKRRLGQRERVSVMMDISKRHIAFLPEQITGHIIKYMIDEAEKHLQHRIKRCVVTHPARFFRPQINALERAFQENGVEVSAFINEAVASALDAILEQGKTEKTEYTIIVYDFGGGTTDIALLRVNDKIGEDGIREIIPETLGVDGKRRLGGDDVTEKLANLIREKCEKELKQGAYGKMIWESDDDSKAIDVPDGLDINEIRNSAIMNMLTLINSAEDHKKRLANGENARLPLLGLNYINNDGKIETFTFSAEITEKELNALIEGDIKDAMSLAWNLVKSANERDESDIKYPDIFVLSGMSSRLPIVKELAEEIFPDSYVWLHPDPKACVARGAYLIHAMSEFPAMVSVDTTMLKSPPPTSAQYGIMLYGLHGEPIFKSAIPKSARLPAEGIISGFRIGRKTAITVYENPGTGISEPEIRKIAVCRLNIPESITDRELRTAQVFMRLEDEMTLKIVLRVGDKDYEFNAVVEPYI
jgi:molecular chaperone DnaK (HSP70)